uniref:Uncharacterized protein n=1 Tax=Aegilops tauschii subsp. strangulata TaxID=200361 RepID=A0A452YUL1_AEGTS
HLYHITFGELQAPFNIALILLQQINKNQKKQSELEKWLADDYWSRKVWFLIP